MRTPDHLRNTPAGHGRWLPAAPAPRALDLSHWLTRAARGHTWNADGVTQRRRSH